MEPQLIEADSSAGFNYPYYLAAPAGSSTDEPVYPLVEPPSMPAPDDDFDTHMEMARRRIEGGFGRRVADELGVPIIHPVFPRPMSTPVDFTHYTHSLDRETITLDDTPLADIDRQLLAMVDDARGRLAEAGIATHERFLMNGFSASANFANRFSALHPTKVLSVSAGGFNGMAILPKESTEVPLEGIDRQTLNFPVGIADIEAITGEPFDLEAFRSVKQFLYLGAEDTNDPLLYPDAWTGVDDRMSALFAYGEDIHEERYPASKQAYAEEEIQAVFKRYPATGHEPMPAFDDIIAFHELAIAGADIDEIRETID